MRIVDALDETYVDTDSAIPLGLIVNEFVTNSLKYAFDGDGGAITLSLMREDGRGTLTLADDGRGMSEDDRRSGGTGMRIIGGLANQLGATAEWERKGGTQLRFSFPVRDRPAAQ